jgi:hypothetical protein
LLAQLPVKLARVLMFVTTRKGGVAYDDTVLLALRNDDGTLDLRSFRFQWQVSGHHIPSSAHLDDATEERLIGLTELVMWKDTVTQPDEELCLVYQKGHHSPWVAELYERSQKA